MRLIKNFSAICLIAMASIFMSACSKSDSYGSSGGGIPAAQNISITSTGFTPATVTVAVGTLISWNNTDSGPHTVVSDDGTSFNSGNIASMTSFNFTPTVTGAFTYHCGIHAAETGTIQVVIK